MEPGCRENVFSVTEKLKVVSLEGKSGGFRSKIQLGVVCRQSHLL